MIIFMTNFKKIFVFILLFFIFFNVNSYSEVVNKVEVTGNDRISLETIMVFGDGSVGKNYEPSDVNLLIKKLFESNFFSNISVKLKNNKLSIVVEENSLINSIIIEGEKAEKFKEKLLDTIVVWFNKCGDFPGYMEWNMTILGPAKGFYNFFLLWFAANEPPPTSQVF